MDLGLRERYERFTREVADAARELGRDPAAITIVAVTKTQSAAALRAVRDAGLSDVGENYVQEARAKFEEAQVEGLRRHFIGHIQTNKARAIVQLFDVVQSIDRLDAARALSRAAASAGKRLPVLLQVNVSATVRFGCPPGDAGSLAEAVRGEAGLDLQGVMAIGPATGDRAEVARSFGLARSVCGEIGGTVLSIGMSGDWREALAAGSTMLRVGSGLFGPRPRKAELEATSKT